MSDLFKFTFGLYFQDIELSSLCESVVEYLDNPFRLAIGQLHNPFKSFQLIQANIDLEI